MLRYTSVSCPARSRRELTKILTQRLLLGQSRRTIMAVHLSFSSRKCLGNLMPGDHYFPNQCNGKIASRSTFKIVILSSQQVAQRIFRRLEPQILPHITRTLTCLLHNFELDIITHATCFIGPTCIRLYITRSRCRRKMMTIVQLHYSPCAYGRR